ncbi:AAA family ATPase [Rhodococcus hoagii]|nr:AAA family ATPase [Prescottella equi]
MALTIAISNTKGGVGKTTSTVLLACALTTRGMTVEVWTPTPRGPRPHGWRGRGGRPRPVPPLPHERSQSAPARVVGRRAVD